MLSGMWRFLLSVYSITLDKVSMVSTHDGSPTVRAGFLEVTTVRWFYVGLVSGLYMLGGSGWGHVKGK